MENVFGILASKCRVQHDTIDQSQRLSETLFNICCAEDTPLRIQVSTTADDIATANEPAVNVSDENHRDPMREAKHL